jgi:hypothetical protein
MFEPMTPVLELESRLGRVGSIQAWDPWESRKSFEKAKWWVSKIASLSYGNEEAKNVDKLYEKIVSNGHLSCLEFVPAPYRNWSIPLASARTYTSEDGTMGLYFNEDMSIDSEDNEATAFLIECPIFVARQWMRHRNFSYLEMSRRYTNGFKVFWSFYGENEHTKSINEACCSAYDAMIEDGVPTELARRVIPVGAMTKFWVAGYDRDWKRFIKLRSDSHAQAEIHVFSDKISEIIAGKSR